MKIKKSNVISLIFPDLQIDSSLQLSHPKWNLHKDHTLMESLQDILDGKASVSDKTLRSLYHEFYHLSSTGILWVTPFLIEYLLTPEGEYSYSEVELFIFFLDAQPGQNDRLSYALQQFTHCQLVFLQMAISQLSNRDPWKDSLADEISKALCGISSVIEERGHRAMLL